MKVWQDRNATSDAAVGVVLVNGDRELCNNLACTGGDVMGMVGLHSNDSIGDS